MIEASDVNVKGRVPSALARVIATEQSTTPGQNAIIPNFQDVSKDGNQLNAAVSTKNLKPLKKLTLPAKMSAREPGVNKVTNRYKKNPAHQNASK